MSDPGKLAADLLQQHFPKFGTFRQLCNYRSKAKTSYDTGTGKVTPGADVDYDLYLINDSLSSGSGSFSDLQIDDQAVLSIDRQAIFPALDLPVTPKINDEITDPDGRVWRVMGVQYDPKPAHYALHIRPLTDG